MSLIALFVAGGAGIYYYYSSSSKTEEPVTKEGIVPVSSDSVILESFPPATLASSLSTNPGTFVPGADVDRSLYETQVKHLSMASRFAYG